MNRRTETRKQQGASFSAVCVPKLDRIQLVVPRLERRFARKLPVIAGFDRKKDQFVRPQTSVVTYRRVRILENPKSASKLYIQYWPAHGWLRPVKITVVGSDEAGIPWPDLRTISAAFGDDLVISMLELALDFSRASGVDLAFVLAHGRFGKSQLDTSRQFPGLLRYGTRKSAKMVRVYRKTEVNAFRLEVEMHSRWSGLPQTVYLLSNLPLSERDVQFLEMDWRALESHLRRCRPGVQRILHEARRRAGSLPELLRFLRDAGVNNPHRFLRRMKINDEIKRALDEWCASVRPRRHREE